MHNVLLVNVEQELIYFDQNVQLALHEQQLFPKETIQFVLNHALYFSMITSISTEMHDFKEHGN